MKVGADGTACASQPEVVEQARHPALLAVMQNESMYPMDISWLRAYAVLIQADAFAHPVQQLGRFGHLKSVSACHMGGLILGHHFDLIDICQNMKSFRPIPLGRLLKS
ncbi:MAG: hypothetical protein AB1443_11950 [Pseudomonadota bacterium]